MEADNEAHEYTSAIDDIAYCITNATVRSIRGRRDETGIVRVTIEPDPSHDTTQSGALQHPSYHMAIEDDGIALPNDLSVRTPVVSTSAQPHTCVHRPSQT